MTHSTNQTQGITAARRKLAAAAALLAIAACAPLPAPQPPTPPGAIDATPAQAAVTPAITPSSRAALQIDTANSLIAITVRRGGVLARLGHDHVVAVRTITGTVSPDRNRAELQFRLDQMTVDEPALRRIAGLETQPSKDAVDGTRHNMLTKVLDAERYPLVTVRAERRPPGQPLKIAITLHGVTREYDVPASIEERDGSLKVTGTVNLKQTDFGLTPFSVMGGAMAVQDGMELRFELVAR